MLAHKASSFYASQIITAYFSSFNEANLNVRAKYVSYGMARAPAQNETLPSSKEGGNMFIKALHIRAILFLLCLTMISLLDPNPANAASPQANLLKVGDKVNVMVEGEDDLSGQYIINKAGTIDMPLIGKILVAGKTAHEAKTEISKKLKDGYLHKPSVSIKENMETAKPKTEAKEALPVNKTAADEKHKADLIKNLKQIAKNCNKRNVGAKRVYIIGAINKPGIYLLPKDAGHILNIVALAGGYTETADTDNFEIVRKIDDVYYRKQAQTGALKYHDGDIVIIEER